MISLNEAHVKRLLRDYVSYYHDDRTHLGLGKNTPSSRLRSEERGRVTSLPRLGGLHHRHGRSNERLVPELDEQNHREVRRKSLILHGGFRAL
jgi:hypothetical protein